MFLFCLALRLGMTVAELGQRLSASELAEWQAFDSISPIGDERADLLTGILAAVMANPHRKRGAAAFKPSDFMPFLDREALAKAERKKAGAALRGRLMGMGKSRR